MKTEVDRYRSLTPREGQLLHDIVDGVPIKATLSKMGIRYKTYHAHRHNLCRKLRIHTTAGLVRFAIRAGAIKP